MIARKLLSLIVLSSLVFGILPNIANGATGSVESPQATPETNSVSNFKSRLMFEENRGQTDRAAKFVSRAPGHNVFLADDEVVFQLKYEMPDQNEAANPKLDRRSFGSDTLRMKFVNGKTAGVTGADESVTKTNYYHHRTRIEHIANFGRVNYERIYDGIDAVFYGTASRALEYDFNIAPNADASQIKLEFDGAESLTVDDAGNLVIKTKNAELVQNKPFAYQMIGGEKREITAEYVHSDQSQIANQKSQISFSLGEYDKTLPLVIDPVVDYATYVGGTELDNINEIAADSAGNAYLVGETSSLNFHGQTRQRNDSDGVFAAKLNAAGTDFEYITILEGNGRDDGKGIAVDSIGNAYISGEATHNFPTTPGAFSTIIGLNAVDGFAAKLAPDGTIVYATYIGGVAAEDGATDIAVDSSGRAHVVGFTSSGISFPQRNRFQGCGYGYYNSTDAFLSVVNATGSDLDYSTCIGGNLTRDEGNGVAVDATGNTYITGFAKGGNFPVKNAFQPDNAGGDDAFVAKFNTNLSGDASLIYASYLGGSGTESGNSIAVDSSGRAVVTGVTGSVNFPLVNAFDSTNVINEAFVTMISSSGTAIVGSSFLGGSDTDVGNNIAVDAGGNIYVAGNTRSNNFPLALPFQPTRRGLTDGFITKLRFGRGVISSSYFGGAGNDFGLGVAVSGNFMFLAGVTESSNLATTSGAVKTVSNAATELSDGFVVKALDTRLDSVGVFRPSSTFILTQSITNVVPQTVTFGGQLAGSLGVSGDFDGDDIDTIGSFTNGAWKFRNINFPTILPFFIAFSFGQAGDLPVTGDWNNDGIDTAGVFRPSTGQFLLTNSAGGTPAVDITINFGVNGDLPVAGDWNADGFDSVGVFRPSTGQFFLTDDNALKATIDQTFFFGTNGDLPVGGDWNGDGIDTVGVYRPSTTEYFLTNDNITFSNVFTFGQVNDQPITGDWDGIPN